MELIGAKLPLAGDLCPCCLPAHYLVTNIAEGRLKPRVAPLHEDDEITARELVGLICDTLESFRRMLMTAHFWYSRWWHHLENHMMGEEDRWQNKGSKSPEWRQKKVRLD